MPNKTAKKTIVVDTKEARKPDQEFWYQDFDIDAPDFPRDDAGDSSEIGLMDIIVEYCTSHGLFMGGSSRSFVVELMSEWQAKWLAEIIDSYFTSHGLKASIKHRRTTDKDY